MDDLAVFLALGLALVILGTPLASLVVAWRARRQIDQLRTRQSEIEGRLAHAEWWVGELVRRGGGAAPEVAPAPPPTAVELSTAGRQLAAPNAAAAASAEPLEPVAVTHPARPAPRARQPFDFEKVVGVRLFAWLGGLGLFAGAAFFLQYTVEHDLLPPAVRVGMGLLVGSGALLLGDVLRPRGDRAGQAVSGAGVAILYASLFAAHALYHLLASSAAFAAMALVTVVAGVMAVRWRAYVLAVIGLAGGFLTPLLLSSGTDETLALFAYVVVLDLGVLFLASRSGWGSLAPLALAASALIYSGWAARYLDAHPPALALGVAWIMAAIFVVSGYLSAKNGEGPSTSGRPPQGQPLLARVLACAAAFAPLVAALFVTDALKSEVDPLFLAGYVAALLLGAAAIAALTGTPFFAELASAAAMLVLAARLGPDVLADRRVTTLLAWSLPAAAVCAAWWVLSRLKVGKPLAAFRGAAAVALAGSWAMVGLSVLLTLDPWSLTPFALYALAHAGAMVAIGLTLVSSRWLLGAQALALASLATLAGRYTPADLREYAAFIVASLLVFFALPVLTPRARSNVAAWVGAAAAPLLHFALLYALARDVWPDVLLGVGALTIAGLALALLAFARERVDLAHKGHVTALLGGLTVLFLSAAIPIALSREWITIAWAVEALGLAWLYTRLSHRGLLAGSALLAGAALVRLTVNSSLWEYHPRSGAVLFNWYLYTFGVPALCLFAAAMVLRHDAVAKRYHYPRALWFAGGLLAFVLLNVQIADAYSSGETIGVHLGASVAEDMTYSLAWGVFALVTLVIGIRLDVTQARISALGVLLLAIAKVFLHDLWHLGALYRVGSMVGLAVALLAVSFLTQKYILRGERS